MSYRDLREWLHEVEKMGEVRTLRGADWNLEIGAIREVVEKEKNGPAVLFDEIKDYPKGFRLLLNSMGSLNRLALTVNVTPEDSKPLSLVKSIKEKLSDLKLMPPKFVQTGPILENVIQGEDINAFMFPTPKWNELDGGRFLGTGSATITADPDDGSVNLGTYRVQVFDKDTLGFYIGPGKHGRVHRDKCFSRGEPLKAAICIGDPMILVAGGMEFPLGQSEYDFIGGIKGEPVEVIKGPFTGLPIPANAEIVIEGESYPGETRMEGPFGEFTGYYASGARPEPFLKIKTILHRNNPILFTAAPGKPPYESGFVRQFTKSANIWHSLEKAGIRDVKGVWSPVAAGAMLMHIVAVKQRYPGHAKQAGVVASSCHAGALMNVYVIVVDDDVDITDMDDVLWALATRSNPAESIDIIRRCWTTPLDTMLTPGAPIHNSRAIIEACRPFERIAKFPPIVGASKELLEEVRKTWGKQLFS